MTVTVQSSRETVTTNGTTGPYTFTFRIFAEADLKVYRNAALLVLNTDYTVSASPWTNGGSITLTVAGASGDTLTILRRAPKTQQTDVIAGDTLPAETLELALDKLVSLMHEAADENNSSLRAPLAELLSVTGFELPAAATRRNKYLRFADTPAALPEMADVSETITTLTQSAIGALLWPITAAETSASLTPTTIYNSVPINVLRYGIVPNSAGAAGANTAALQSLLDPTVTGPVGRVIFPNTTGADIYYFNDRIPVRDGIYIDLMGCTLDFTKTGSSADTNGGAFHALRKFGLKNGKLDVNYTYVAGTNTFAAIALAGRGTDSTDFPSLYDNIETERFGDIEISDLVIDHNGGINCSAIFMLGGLQNVVFRRIRVEGNATLKSAFLYEFGWATNEAAEEDRQSSHAQNMRFSDISVENIDTTSGIALNIRGAYNVDIRNLDVRKAAQGILIFPGEALFYNPWDPENEQPARLVTMANIAMSEIESVAITVTGASANTGYLSPVTIPDEQLVDLYDFDLNGFSILGGTGGTTLAVGIDSSAGSASIRNGTIQAAANGLRFNDEAIQFDIDNIKVIDSTSIAARLDFTGGVFSTERKKNGAIRNSFFGGNEGVTITIDHCEILKLSNNRFGNTTGHNGAAETTQDAAVQVGADAVVIADSNFVAAVAAGNAYTGISGGAGILINPLGNRSSSSHWRMGERLGGMTNVGDTDKTLTPGTDDINQHWNTTLTANRVVTLSTTNAVEGDTFKVVRSGLGAFTLDVGGLKTIPSATAATVDVMYDGAAWRLTNYGAL